MMQKVEIFESNNRSIAAEDVKQQLNKQRKLIEKRNEELARLIQLDKDLMDEIHRSKELTRIANEVGLFNKEEMK